MHLEAFAGLGGASLGLHRAGVHAVGVELDATVCASRALAGWPTIRADVATLPLAHLRGRVRGVWASPPCPTFSTAGKGKGRDDLAHLYAFAEAFDRHGWRDPWRLHHWSDARTPLVLEPLRIVSEVEPEWLLCEQVPPCVGLWDAFAYCLSERGYYVWAGILNAADYGVPQTRQRAILMASTRAPVFPPEATHAEEPLPRLWGGELAPWVSMAEALGWDGTEAVGFARRNDRGSGPYRVRDLRPSSRPAFTITEKARSWRVDRRTWDHYPDGSKRRTRPVPITEPAPALVQGWKWKVTDGATSEPVKLTIAEALVLQGFPPDYPVAGGAPARQYTRQYMQLGDAVPPPLAEACVRAVMAP